MENKNFISIPLREISNLQELQGRVFAVEAYINTDKFPDAGVIAAMLGVQYNARKEKP